MKQRKRLTAGILSVLITVAAWLLVFWQEGILWAPAEEVAAAPAYIDLSPGTAEDIIALSWEYDGEELILTRDTSDGQWYDLEDRDCPIDSELVNALAATVADTRATLEIQNPGDPAQYGLDVPCLTLLAATEDRMITYELGNMTLKGETYLRVDRGDTVFLETGALSSAFSLCREDLLRPETLSSDPGTVISVSVKTVDGDYTLTRCTEPPDGWYGVGDGWFYRSEDMLLPLDTDAAEAFCAALAQISLSDCVAWDETDMAALGLSDPRTSAELTFTDEDRLLLEFGNWEDGSVFVRSGASGCAYRTDSALLDTLLHPDLSALQSRCVCLMDWSLVTGGELTILEGSVSIERIREPDPEDPSGEPTDYVLADGWTLEPDRVQMWVSRLDSLEGTPVSAAVPEGEALLSLRLSLDDKDVTFSLYAYDSTRYLCRMEDRVFLVEQTTPDSLLNDAKDFIAST